MSMWPKNDNADVLPYEKKRMPRRSKKNRKRGKEESPKRMRSGGVRCKGCDEFGHNIRTCPRGAGSSSRRPKKV
ncbi:hypothetical protein ACOSQ3_021511 [Xanthoceras sorbifolium]